MIDFKNIESSKNPEMVKIDEYLKELKNNIDRNPIEKDF
jgi:hypothetical protein